MAKIPMKTPLVEMDGDEMTRVLWRMIKDELILPFVDLKTEYYDLGLLNRNATKDQVTVASAEAAKRLGVAVKCATITPNRQRMEEYPELTEMWKSPNGTIRSIIGGTIFRTPIVIDSIKPAVKNWKKPITIARHGYGDVYKAVDMFTEEPGTATLTFRGESAPRGPSRYRRSADRLYGRPLITFRKASAASRDPASSTPSTQSRISGSPQRIRSPKSMTVNSREFSRKSSRHIKTGLTSLASNTSIP